MKKFISAILIFFGAITVGYVGVYVYAVYFYKPDALTQAYLDEKDPHQKLVLLEKKLNSDSYERWAWLDDAAELAYKVEDYEKAHNYASESISLSNRYESDWNYGNSIHNSNMVLGRLALKEGSVEHAKEYLKRAGDSRGSPQLDTFGPDMQLADDLLNQGEKDAVLSYLSSINKFWEMDDGCVDRWIKQIKSGEKPKLCKCSCK